MLQNVHIMIGPKVVDVSIYEQSIMVKNDLVVDYKDFLPTIKPILVQFVIPWFSNLDQIAINETNTTWKLLKLNT
jgi:hypothetical protein